MMEAIRRLPARGTLLNTLTVLVGSTLGLVLRTTIPENLKPFFLSALGLVTVSMGIKLFLETKNVLIVAVYVVLGGAIGKMLGIDIGLEHLAEWARGVLGGGGTFNEGLITASVLFCVGPMTLLGCMKDGLERDIELLAFKSTMDGVASIFFAAALGSGVLASAAIVLVFQGALTLMAGTLKPLAEDKRLLAETTAAGGPILLSIGLSLLAITKIPSEVFLPALVLAPFVTKLFEVGSPKVSPAS